MALRVEQEPPIAEPLAVTPTAKAFDACMLTLTLPLAYTDNRTRIEMIPAVGNVQMPVPVAEVT